MKLLEYDKSKGFLKVLIEVPEDLYYLSLILDKNDLVYSWTTRQIKIDKAERSIKGERKRVYLGIKVVTFDFHRFLRNLRIRGIVIDAPEYMHIKGSYHTLSVDVGSELTIYKERIFPFIDRILRMAASHYKKMLLISIGDDEISLGYLTPLGIEISYTRHISVDKKREKGYSILETYRKSLIDFFEKKREDFIRIEDIDEIVIAGTSLLLPLVKEIIRDKKYFQNKSLRTVQVSEGGKAGIYEILRREDLRQLFRNTRFIFEKRIIDDLFKYLIREDRKVAVGLEEVRLAAEYRAIKTLILNDIMFFDLERREELKDILDKTLESSGDIVIISRESEHGKQLEGLGNIAAILYFKIWN